MTRCVICTRPVGHDRDPYYLKTDSRHYANDAHLVAMRNGLYVEACWSCWMRWPDEHKTWPDVAFGRPLDLVSVLRATTT